jgi:hypothetical protein
MAPIKTIGHVAHLFANSKPYIKERPSSSREGVYVDRTIGTKHNGTSTRIISVLRFNGNAPYQLLVKLSPDKTLQMASMYAWISRPETSLHLSPTDLRRQGKLLHHENTLFIPPAEKSPIAFWGHYSDQNTFRLFDLLGRNCWQFYKTLALFNCYVTQGKTYTEENRYGIYVDALGHLPDIEQQNTATRLLRDEIESSHMHYGDKFKLVDQLVNILPYEGTEKIQKTRKPHMFTHADAVKGLDN